MPGKLLRLQTLNTQRTKDDPQPRLKPRGLPPALEPHGVYVATNPAEAALYGRDLLGTHRVIPTEVDGTEFLSSFHGVLIRDITLGYLDYSVAVRVDVQKLPDDVVVIVPASGASTVTVGDDAVAATPVMAAVPKPGAPMTLTCDADAAHLLIRIDRQALDVHLARLLGRTVDQPIEFDLAFDLSTGEASRWNFAVQMLHSELYDTQSLLHAGIGLGPLEEFMMSALLFTQPSNYSDRLVARPRKVHAAIRHAQEFIEANLAMKISGRDIADAAGVSVRTLQALFAEELHQTPTQYLRNHRLERVRAALADANPRRGETVGDIALRWGFTHLGRFAAEYRARFGESPSETLRS